ncbi:hypothetical protein BH24ACT3_BH24ACT3_12730 [soil metagenome]
MAVMEDRGFAAMSDAVLAIAAERSVEPVLERLVETARRLVGARYAALGVPDADSDGFAAFHTAGVSDELIEEIGPLPRTHGLRGATLADPRPFRTDDVRADPRFGWWPDAHPRMGSFLAVPIVFKGDVVGAFYLADKVDQSGEVADGFDDEDEATIAVLAAHAAVAIENARLSERSRELSILEERNRMARELHDSLTQTLFSLTLTADAASSLVRTDPARAEVELDQVRSLVDQAVGELRTLVTDLRPPTLDDEGLVVTVGKHLDLLSRAHGLAVTLDAQGEQRLDPEVEGVLFRIVQEALTNVVRHAAAQTVHVWLVLGPEVATASVRDDGAGFDPEARLISARRLGLTSMRERAEDLCGTLVVRSAPGAGTTVQAEVPVG